MVGSVAGTRSMAWAKASRSITHPGRVDGRTPDLDGLKLGSVEVGGVLRTAGAVDRQPATRSRHSA